MPDRERRRRRIRRDPAAGREPRQPAAPDPPRRPVPQPPPERPSEPAESPEPTAQAADGSGAPAPRPGRRRRERGRPERPWATEKGGNGEERDVERGLRGLVGAGPSQVGPAAAMRARDAARPTEEDLAAAERELAVVRRHWVPPTERS